MPPFAVGGWRGAPGWLRIVSSPKQSEKKAIGQPETLSFLLMMASVPVMFVFSLSAEEMGVPSPQE